MLWELNKSSLYRAKSIADFFLPRLCSACKMNLLPTEQVICDSCYSKIQRVNPERLELEFSRKFEKENLISDFRALFIFEKDKEFQSIIHELKYSGKFRIGIYLGKLIATELKEEIAKLKADLIIPIPLNKLKKAERSYNQSYFIGKGIKSIFNIPVEDRIVYRDKFTESQTTMSLIERKENIKDAFKIKNSKKVRGKNIIIVDDVITTGATVSECAKVLIDNGAKNIFALSIALAD